MVNNLLFSPPLWEWRRLPPLPARWPITYTLHGKLIPLLNTAHFRNFNYRRRREREEEKKCCMLTLMHEYCIRPREPRPSSVWTFLRLRHKHERRKTVGLVPPPRTNPVICEFPVCFPPPPVFCRLELFPVPRCYRAVGLEGGGKKVKAIYT